MKKEDIGEEQDVQETPKTIEERLGSIEDKLNKTSRWAAVFALLGTACPARRRVFSKLRRLKIAMLAT
jgi:hypothetical protein